MVQRYQQQGAGERCRRVDIGAKNQRNLIAQNIPDDRFFIETDCPYLSPQFMRGKRNEPSYIKAIAKKIAELRHTTFPEISRISTENAKSFFKF